MRSLPPAAEWSVDQLIAHAVLRDIAGDVLIHSIFIQITTIPGIIEYPRQISPMERKRVRPRRPYNTLRRMLPREAKVTSSKLIRRGAS